MKKYRVLHIFSSFSMGGAERTTLFLASNLQKTAECDNIVAAPFGSKLYEESLQKNIKTVAFEAANAFDPSGILQLLKIVNQNNINILHAHQGKLFWTSLIIKLFSHNLKVVFHRRQDTRHGFVSKNHYRFVDAVITVSQAVANGLIKYEKVNPNKIKVIYNGVNVEKFSGNIDFSNVIKEYNLQDKIVVGVVANIVDFNGKGQIYLMEAAKILRDQYSNLRYLIVGSGKGLEEQRAYAKKLEVDDIIYFTGFQNQPQEFVAAMDIFCLPAWDTEGMPNVVVEAEALGKPVIVTNVGGNPESFVDGTTGIMVEPSNPLQIAYAIKKLIDNPELAKQMGVEGEKFVKKKFVIEKTVADTLEVYGKIINL